MEHAIKQFVNKRIPPNKHHWTENELSFLRMNFHSKTNRQLADVLGLKLTLVRMKCYELGLRRMVLEYWTDEQVQVLKGTFRKIGDHEIAEMFTTRWPKAKGWSYKHIAKKRMHLQLKRTKDEIDAIKLHNIQTGRFKLCPVKAWDKRGRAPDGEIRYWKIAGSDTARPFIKVGGRFVHWARYTWEQAYGEVQKGMNVVFLDNDPYNLTLENLCLLTDGQLSARNSLTSSKGLSDNYVVGTLSHGKPLLRQLFKGRPDLIDLKRQQLILKRIINERVNH